MYHCQCHDCGEAQVVDELEVAQDFFNDHAEQRCEVEFRNVALDGVSAEDVIHTDEANAESGTVDD